MGDLPHLNCAESATRGVIKEGWLMAEEAVRNADATKPELRCMITSEYGKLRSVLVHRPGKEIDRLNPLNKERFLFEDIPHLERMQKEHDFFCECMHNEDIQVLYLEELVGQIVKENDQVRSDLVMAAFAFSWQPGAANLILERCKPRDITRMLFEGVTALELQDITGREVGPVTRRKDYSILEPIPNAYFPRDTAVAIKHGIASCKTRFRARVRETLLVRTVFESHPDFKNFDVFFGNSKTPSEERPFMIEGGDVMVLSDSAVVVGCGERTRPESIYMLATKLFGSGRARRVYQIDIPSEREYMHLDTVFTIVNRGIIVAYKDVIDRVKEIRRFEPEPTIGGTIIPFAHREDRKFKRILEDEFDVGLRVIHTGKDDPRYAAREQGADATNTFAVAPSKVIAYERNVHTNEALEDEGVEVFRVAGAELVRGLGGPRCMTMPLERVCVEEQGNGVH